MKVKLLLTRKKIRKLWYSIWKKKMLLKLKLYEGIPFNNEELVALSSSIDNDFEKIKKLQQLIYK